jgi:hypothetical protein
MVGVVESAPPRDLATLVRRIVETAPRRSWSRREAGRRRGEEVHLYLDVSGSVESLLGRLHEEVRGVAGLVWRDVHLFATDVTNAPVDDPARGTCQTTGGTSLVPVVQHIRVHGVRRAVIVTDGEVGVLSAADREILGSTVLGVALTNPEERHGDLARIARHVVVLPGLEEEGVGSTFYALRERRA